MVRHFGVVGVIVVILLLLIGLLLYVVWTKGLTEGWRRQIVSSSRYPHLASEKTEKLDAGTKMILSGKPNTERVSIAVTEVGAQYNLAEWEELNVTYPKTSNFEFELHPKLAYIWADNEAKLGGNLGILRWKWLDVGLGGREDIVGIMAGGNPQTRYPIRSENLWIHLGYGYDWKDETGRFMAGIAIGF